MKQRPGRPSVASMIHAARVTEGWQAGARLTAHLWSRVEYQCRPATTGTAVVRLERKAASLTYYGPGGAAR
jgi:hypothetical protein